MNKRFLCGVAAAGMLLGGCSAAALETVPIASDAAVMATESRFAFGQEVWSVRRSSGDDQAYVVRYAVVAQEGNLVAVVPMFTPDSEELRQTLTEMAQMPLDGTGHLYLVTEDNCWLDPVQAQAAADREAD